MKIAPGAVPPAESGPQERIDLGSSNEKTMWQKVGGRLSLIAGVTVGVGFLVLAVIFWVFDEGHRQAADKGEQTTDADAVDAGRSDLQSSTENSDAQPPDPNAGAKAGAQADPADPSANPPDDPSADQVAGTPADPAQDPASEPNADPGTEPKTDPDLDFQPSAPQVDPLPGPRPDSQPDGEPDPKADPQSDSPTDSLPTERELMALGQALTKARLALANRSFSDASRELAEAKRLAKLPEHRGKVERLKLLADYVQQFWDAYHDGLKGLQAGHELVIGNARIAVVEVGPESLVLRSRGENRRLAVGDLPPTAVMAIADRWFDQRVASTKVFKGAYMAVDPQGSRSAAQRLWEEARLGGADVTDLMQVLSDKYIFVD